MFEIAMIKTLVLNIHLLVLGNYLLFDIWDLEFAILNA